MPRHLLALAALCAVFQTALAASSDSSPAKSDSSPEKIFPDLKIYDAQGRPWRIAQEDWDGARKRVASDPAWAAWLKRERAEVDAWIANHHDRVEWAAGWSHDFVSPKDGSHLMWTDAIPGEQTDHFSSPSDPHVAITPKLFAAWVRLFRERNATMMERAARLYRLIGEKSYAEWAAGQLDFYTDNYLKWKPERGGARLYWQTLTEATNLITYAHVVRHLGDFVTPERKEHWHKDFFLPEVAVLNGTYQNIHNIACWHRSAVAQVALLFGDEAMWRDAVDGPHGIRQQVAQGITADYLWVEQSFGYAGGVAQALTSLYTEAAVYGREGEFAHEMAETEDLLLAPIYYRFPNGQLPNPADSGGIGRAPNRRSLAAVYRVLPTTLGLATLTGRGRRGEDTPIPSDATGGNETVPRRGNGWDLLLDPPISAAKPGPLPEVTSHNLEATRMAILKANGWQVFFHYGQITRSHTESEALNYAAFYGTADITHDPGTTGYGSPLHLGYHTRGLSENDPLVDGEGEYLGPFGERREWIIEIINPDWPMRGQLLEYSENPARVSAAQPQYRPEASAKRTLEIKGNQLVDTTFIETTGGDHKLGLALHLQGKVKLPDSFHPDPHFADGRSEPFSYWQDVTGASFHDRAEFDVDYGTVVMHVTLELPGEFKLWHASTPDIAPARRESFYLETTGTKETFVTTFTPKGQPPTVVPPMPDRPEWNGGMQ
ncbi:MAG TPA: heparinase [Opitutaceae bacterium]|jgi:hypothetical protein|nr:heparinase [Opitutaceae bacterium]